MKKKVLSLLHNRIFQEILFLFILSLVPLLWYEPGVVMLGHDIGFPINIIDWFKDKLWLWGFKVSNFGSDYSLFSGILIIHGLEAFLSFLGFSIFTVQKLTFVFWFFALALAMYCLVYSFYPGKEYRWFRILSSVFYVFNFFILTRFVIFERTAFSMMVLIPITIVLILKYFQDRTSLLKTLSFFGLAPLFFNGGGVPPFLGILMIVMLICFLLYIILEVRTKKEFARVILIGILLLMVFILVNSYWIAPFLYTNLKVYKTVVSEDFTGIINWLNVASQTGSFLNLFKLQGDAAWHQTSEHYSDFFTKTDTGLFLSGLLPIIIFSPFLFIKFTKQKKDKFFVLFFSLLALIFIFLSAGSHPPFGKYYIWLMKNIPFFTVFRTPLYKFSYGIVLAFAFLFGFTLQRLINGVKYSTWIQRRTKRDISNVLGPLFIILILAFNYLYFDIRIFKLWDRFSLRVQLSSYVLEARDFMKGSPQDNRILLLPKLVENYGGIDAYNWGYWSLLPLPRLLFAQPTIVSRDSKPEVSAIISPLYQSINKNDFQTTLQYAKVFNIKYLLLRHDFSYQWNVGSDDPSKIKAILNQNKEHFSSINKFGDWEFYELNIDPAIITGVSAKEGATPVLNTKRINNIKYHVQVQDANSPFTLLFKTTFHPNWKIYLLSNQDNQEKNRLNLLQKLIPFTETWLKKPISEENHFLSNGFANAWLIEPSQKDFKIVIEYWPQRLFYIGLFMSSLTLLSCLGFLFYEKFLR